MTQESKTNVYPIDCATLPYSASLSFWVLEVLNTVVIGVSFFLVMLPTFCS
ncbi:hypothetical protein M758_7G129500 [Ceratodon purpureus]|nr:hypothetical protein M758_7G129500 [Ceratodon purpureus]